MEVILVSDVATYGVDRLYVATDFVEAQLFASMFQGTVREFKTLYIIEVISYEKTK